MKTLDAEKKLLGERLEVTTASSRACARVLRCPGLTDRGLSKASERECKAEEAAKKKNIEQLMNLEYQTSALETEKKRLTEDVEMKQRQLDSAELDQKVLRGQVASPPSSSALANR